MTNLLQERKNWPHVERKPSRRTVQASETVSFHIIVNGSGVTAVERAFKGTVKIHTLIYDNNPQYDEIIEKITGPGDDGRPAGGWKDYVRKVYDLELYSGKN